MTHDEINDHAAARWQSFVLAPGDLMEAVYVGAEHELPPERATWRVVGELVEVAQLGPHPPPADWPGDEYAVPLTDLAERIKLGNVLDA